MPRLMLSDEHWSKLRTIMLQHGIYHKPGLRKMVEGMLHRMRVGCPWRDLPPYFGSWNSIFQKFNRWSTKDKLMKIFKSLVRILTLNGNFWTAVMCAHTSTVPVPQVMEIRQLAFPEAEIRRKFTWPRNLAACQ
jgi:transposase